MPPLSRAAAIDFYDDENLMIITPPQELLLRYMSATFTSNTDDTPHYDAD